MHIHKNQCAVVENWCIYSSPVLQKNSYLKVKLLLFLLTTFQRKHCTYSKMMILNTKPFKYYKFKLLYITFKTHYFIFELSEISKL